MNIEFMSGEKEALLKRIAEAEARAQECQIEAAVYREQLVHIADTAEQTNNPSLLYGVVSQASLTLKHCNVKQWGMEWKALWDQDMKWLEDALRVFAEIRRFATDIKVDDDSANAALKGRILESIGGVLVEHPSSSVSLDDLFRKTLG